MEVSCLDQIYRSSVCTFLNNRKHEHFTNFFFDILIIYGVTKINLNLIILKRLWIFEKVGLKMTNNLMNLEFPNAGTREFKIPRSGILV